MKRIDLNAKYKDTEQWVKKEGDYFLIGITDFTQKVFGNIVLVDLSTIGSQLKTDEKYADLESCLLYTSPSPRDATLSRMPSSA